MQASILVLLLITFFSMLEGSEAEVSKSTELVSGTFCLYDFYSIVEHIFLVSL
jgi:hypothetical protein